MRIVKLYSLLAKQFRNLSIQLFCDKHPITYQHVLKQLKRTRTCQFNQLFHLPVKKFESVISIESNNIYINTNRSKQAYDKFLVHF